MTFIDENTSRADLEDAAIVECGLDIAAVDAATDAELLAMVRKWILEGDECAAS